MKDILQDGSFDQLHEKIENGKHEVFEFHLPIGKVRHSFIKREISVQISGEVYYDITTPYSHGGPVVTACHEEDKWELVDEFQRAFQAYCKENKIVSEYVRFPPLLSNVLDFVCIYEVDCKCEKSENSFYSDDREKSTLAEINEKTSEFNMCVGKKIWNEEIYRDICAAVRIGADVDFFPAYRLKENY